MSNARPMISGMPDQAVSCLEAMGKRIRVARRRRRITVEEMAERVMVSPPTLRKLENGDPSVLLGVYVVALCILGLVSGLDGVADPDKDIVGIACERRMPRRRATARAGGIDDDF
jgi:DNA-binding XRE family transcriptional regulator